ncbi:MFS superfamily transporter, partial [Lacticaseibacillus rhamnosus MTCC 5462]
RYACDLAVTGWVYFERSGDFWIFVIDALTAVLAVLCLGIVHVPTPVTNPDQATKQQMALLPDCATWVT